MSSRAVPRLRTAPGPPLRARSTAAADAGKLRPGVGSITDEAKKRIEKAAPTTGAGQQAAPPPQGAPTPQPDDELRALRERVEERALQDRRRDEALRRWMEE